MDGLTQKVEIKQDVNYQGTSFGDIFEKRAEERLLSKKTGKNQFLQMPEEFQEEEDADFAQSRFVKRGNHPYQSKVLYLHQEESSELDESSYNSDDKFA